MRERLNQIKSNFIENIAVVEKLMKFDEAIQIFCLNALRKANKGLEKFDCADHPSYNIKPIIKQVENIRQNDSLRPSYEIMLNQCVVLLVSYFSSAIEDLFREALNKKIQNGNIGKLEKEEIKVTISQLVHNPDVADLFLLRKDISFQDMKSIARAFEEYIEIEQIPQDEVVNNIILSQACRHCIVHDGSVVNMRVLGQLSSATPRDLKPDMKKDDIIQFNEDEIKIIIESMNRYIDRLFEKLLK